MRPSKQLVGQHRPLLLTITIAGHLLIFALFARYQRTPERWNDEPSLIVTSLDIPERHRLTRPPPLNDISRGPPADLKSRKHRLPDTAPPDQAPISPPPTDWAQEAEIVREHRLQEDADAARRDGVLSRWKAGALPSAAAPSTPPFRWDSSHIKPLEPTRQGLVVHLNERCVLVISPLSLIGGCKIGDIPVHGDLFDHMDDLR